MNTKFCFARIFTILSRPSCYNLSHFPLHLICLRMFFIWTFSVISVVIKATITGDLSILGLFNFLTAWGS